MLNGPNKAAAAHPDTGGDAAELVSVISPKNAPMMKNQVASLGSRFFSFSPKLAVRMDRHVPHDAPDSGKHGQKGVW